MVAPARVPGEHDVFVAGNDAGRQGAGAGAAPELRLADERIIDLGDITAARGTEMYVALWLRLWGALQTADFNIRVVK